MFTYRITTNGTLFRVQRSVFGIFWATLYMLYSRIYWAMVT